VLVFCLIAGCATAVVDEIQPPTSDYLQRDAVQSFIEEMVSEGFERSDLEQVFVEAEYQQGIIDAISRPAERVLTWDSYQDIFLTERRLREGRAFVEMHQETFARAEETYGVPTEVIAAIIGVETFYGRIKGKHRVIDALSTLAFDYPPRSKFFRSELKEFFYLVREEQKSALEPVGSYAGAMGYGQFISSSYRNYAVDFDGDGIRDIWNNPVDAIGSVANYLARHKWQAGEPIVVRVDGEFDGSAELFNESLRPSISLGALEQLGLITGLNRSLEELVSPMRLQGKKGDEFWIGFNNFYVITRYNHSKLYAMAVFQLSEQIRTATNSAARSSGLP
jgi:membrane-bound lytic murein transglycosylase B